MGIRLSRAEECAQAKDRAGAVLPMLGWSEQFRQGPEGAAWAPRVRAHPAEGTLNPLKPR